MNKVFESKTMVVHDDREFITPEQAFDILWTGKEIMICDFPDFSAEWEGDIYKHPFRVYLKDVLSEETWQNFKTISKEKIKQEVFEYLMSYEISK